MEDRSITVRLNAIDYDSNGVFDSVIDPDNPFSNSIKQSKNLVNRDKKKLYVKKYHDE